MMSPIEPTTRTSMDARSGHSQAVINAARITATMTAVKKVAGLNFTHDSFQGFLLFPSAVAATWVQTQR